MAVFVFFATAALLLHSGSCLQITNPMTQRPTGTLLEKYWTGMAMTADGKTRLACVKGGKLWGSIDAGFSWTEMSHGVLSSNKPFVDVAMSADGVISLALIESSNSLYRSTDSWATWHIVSLPKSTMWTGVAMSADGISCQIIAKYSSSSNNWYYSTDSGATWATGARPSKTDPYFDAIAMSADGVIRTVVSSGPHADVVTSPLPQPCAAAAADLAVAAPRSSGLGHLPLLR